MPTTGNFDLADYFPYGIFLTDIALISSGVGDILQVREGSATGPILCRIQDKDGSGDHRRFNGNKKFVYIVGTECTFSNMTTAVVVIEFR
jgi:hypothetical protein